MGRKRFEEEHDLTFFAVLFRFLMVSGNAIPNSFKS